MNVLKTLWEKPRFGRRFWMMLVALTAIAGGISLVNMGGAGTDPFTSQNLQIAVRTGLSVTATQTVVMGIMLLWAWRCTPALLGVGTVMNMVLFGALLEGFLWLYGWVLPPSLSLWGRVCVLLIGFLVFALGASLYFTANLGVSAYDCAAFYLEEKTPLTFKSARICTDLFCVAMTMLLGGTVGLGTLLCALGTGPMVSWMNRHISEPILYGRQKGRAG